MARGEEAFRYAPSVDQFRFTPSDALRDRLAADPESDPEGLAELLVFHRFVGHGNRDWSTELEEYDLTLGLAGRFANDAGYDAFLRYYRHDARETGGNFVSETAARDATAAGHYDVENPFSIAEEHLTAIRDTTLRLTRDEVTDHRTAGVLLDGAAFAFRGNDVRWAAGVEVADEDYRNGHPCVGPINGGGTGAGPCARYGRRTGAELEHQRFLNREVAEQLAAACRDEPVEWLPIADQAPLDGDDRFTAPGSRMRFGILPARPELTKGEPTVPEIKRTPTNAGTLATLAGHARLELSSERAATLAPALDGVLELLDSLDAVKLGETAPAFAYRAKWEGTR